MNKPRVTIEYCTQCQWLLRSAWLAQELLSTFSTDFGEVALVPSTGGVFTIHLANQVVWERVQDGGFPEAKELKRRVRDIIVPDRSLGHIDK